MPRMWYYFNGSPEMAGPVPTDALRFLIKQGVLNRETPVFQEGKNKMVSAGTIEGLFPKEDHSGQHGSQHHQHARQPVQPFYPDRESFVPNSNVVKRKTTATCREATTQAGWKFLKDYFLTEPKIVDFAICENGSIWYPPCSLCSKLTRRLKCEKYTK